MVILEQLIEHLISFIVAQGSMGIFLASIIEEFIVPIPSTVIQTGGGFLFLAGQAFSLSTFLTLIFKIALPAALGATVGSLFIYGLVFFGGKPFVARYGKYIFLNAEKIDQAHQYVLSHKSLVWAFCLVRFVPVLPSVFVAALAGLIRLPLKTYLLTTMIGMFIRAIYLGAAGWMGGGIFRSLDPQGSLFGMILSFVGAVIVISVLTMVLVFYVKRKKQTTDIQ